jgi:hypothetical protein
MQTHGMKLAYHDYKVSLLKEKIHESNFPALHDIKSAMETTSDHSKT